MSKSFTATVDRSPAEVMILPPQAESLFANNGGQPSRANEASDERVVEVVISADNTPFLIGQRVL